MLYQQEYERRPAKHLPHLDNKKVLFIDNFDISCYLPVWLYNFHSERLKVIAMETLPSGINGQPTTLAEYMRLESIDALIIHPVMNATWIKELVEVLENNIPVIIAEGVPSDNESIDTYQWFRDLRIPIVKKSSGKLYEEILDQLEAQFTAGKR
jgi:hypothetical protein